MKVLKNKKWLYIQWNKGRKAAYVHLAYNFPERSGRHRAFFAPFSQEQDNKFSEDTA